MIMCFLHGSDRDVFGCCGGLVAPLRAAADLVRGSTADYPLPALIDALG